MLIELRATKLGEPTLKGSLVRVQTNGQITKGSIVVDGEIVYHAKRHIIIDWGKGPNILYRFYGKSGIHLDCSNGKEIGGDINK